MTFDEALATLGIDLSVDEAGARRAYLRLIKTHSPERDPTTFQQVRQAYELLRESAYRLGQRTSPEPVPSLLAASPTLAPAPPPSVRRMELARAALAEAEGDEEQLAIAEQTARELGAEEAYWLWLEVADDVGVDDGGRSIVQEAIAAGHRDFREVLRARFPDALTPEELDAWRMEATTATHANWFGLSRALLKRGQAVAAVDNALHGLEQLQQQDLSGYHRAQAGLTDLGFRLLMVGEFVQAERIVSAAAGLDGHDRALDPVRYEILKELLRLRPHLSEPVVRELAETTHDSNHNASELILEEFVRKHWMRALSLSKQMQRDAPTLFGFYGNVFPRLALTGYYLRRFLRQVLIAAFVVSALVGVFGFIVVFEALGTPVARDLPVNVSLEQSKDQVVSVTCTPPQAEFCRDMPTLLSKTPGCTGKLHIRNKLADWFDRGVRGKRTAADYVQAANLLRDQVYQHCGGAITP